MNPFTSSRWLTAESQAVDNLIKRIQDAEAKHSMEYRGFLAKARRLFGKMPDADAGATVEILSHLVDNGLPLSDTTHSIDGMNTRERAAVTAIALYAGSHRMAHSESVGFGTALARIVSESREEHSGQSIPKRFAPIFDASDYQSIIYDLSRILGVMSDSTTIDYALLTNDLVALQAHDNAIQSKVRIKWAKEYYMASGVGDPDTKNNK